jgi:two-component system sensor histidine kinase VicK
MIQLDENIIHTIEEIGNLGSYEVDISTGIWHGSDNFIAIFGLPKKEYYTVEEFRSLIHPDDYDEVIEFYEQCLQEGTDFNYDYRCLRNNGEVIHVSSRSRVTYQPDGTPEKVIGIKQDITQRKNYELQLIQLNKLIELKNRVLYEVAHDLRAPIAQISALAMFIMNNLEGENRKIFAELHKTSKTTNHLINELIEYAELEKPDITTNKSETDINKVISNSIQRFTHQINEKHLTISASYGSNCIVFADEVKISRVIDNLLSNAIKFTPQYKNIHFTTTCMPETVKIEIADEGIGMDQKQLDALFDMSAETPARIGTVGERSSGLGMSIIKQIIDLHHGEITVNSTLNQGTTFTLELDAA